MHYYPILSFLIGVSSSPLFWYAVGKFIATLLFGAILYFFVRKMKSAFGRALMLALPIVIQMEMRYIASGHYGALWHVYNVINHTLIMFIASYLVFWKAGAFEQR